MAEIRFVGHVAGQRGVVAENGVFGYLLAVPYALEVLPEMRSFLVPGDAAISEPFGDGFLAGLGVMILVPFLEIGIAHGVRIAVSVITRGIVFTGLREISDGGFRDFEDSLRTLEAVDFRRIAAEIQAQIYRRPAVIEQRAVNVGHIEIGRAHV